MSVQEKDGGPAFPADPTRDHSGMSLRDWFAGQALAGVIDVCRGDTVGVGETREMLFAWKAYRIADAMLSARQHKDPAP
jgi:hypothetical protein